MERRILKWRIDYCLRKMLLERLLGCKCEIATMTSKSLEEYYGYRDYCGCRTKGE